MVGYIKQMYEKKMSKIVSTKHSMVDSDTNIFINRPFIDSFSD